MSISVCACVRERARGCVGGFLNISIGVVRLKQLKLLSFKRQSRKAYYSYLTPGSVARSVACKLRKQVLRSILAFGTFFVENNFHLPLIKEKQVVRYWRKNGT